jgi:hypothetical protein
VWLKGSAKEDLGGPAPGQGHEAHAFLEVAVAGQQFESRLDEGLRIQGGETDTAKVGNTPACPLGTPFSIRSNERACRTPQHLFSGAGEIDGLCRRGHPTTSS